MITKEAKKIKKTSWTETIERMTAGSILTCTLKEKLSAGAILSRYKKENPEAEFSKWVDLGNNKHSITRLK